MNKDEERDEDVDWVDKELEEFRRWYEENENRFHSCQFSESEIALSAWMASRRNTRRECANSA